MKWASHKIVESYTDPESCGIIGYTGTCENEDGWCGIADICENITGTVNGVTVQA